MRRLMKIYDHLNLALLCKLARDTSCYPCKVPDLAPLSYCISLSNNLESSDSQLPFDFAVILLDPDLALWSSYCYDMDILPLSATLTRSVMYRGLLSL